MTYKANDSSSYANRMLFPFTNNDLVTVLGLRKAKSKACLVVGN